MKYLSILFCLLAVIIQSGTARAHGLAITQQQIVNNYLIEFEYDGTGQVLAGELTSYAFELLDKTHNEQVPYERLFVKISKQGSSRPTFAANLVPVELLGRKAARANITLSEMGSYAVDLSFFNGTQELAKTTFNFDVAVNPATVPPEESKAKQYAYFGIFIVLLIVIAVETLWLIRGKRNVDLK